MTAGRTGGEGTAVRIPTSEPGRFHDGSQSSRPRTGLAPTAVHIRTSEPFYRLDYSPKFTRVVYIYIYMYVCVYIYIYDMCSSI